MNKNVKRRLLALLLSINTLLVGCGNNVDCDIKGKHIHLYTSEDGIDRYIKGEHESISDGGRTFYRTEEYETLDKTNTDFYNMVSDNELINISENLDALRSIVSGLKDYYMFEYYSIDTSTYTSRNERINDIVEEEHEKTVKSYYWTQSPDNSQLTGKYTVVTHVFYGYNVVKNNKGKYILQKSGPVNDFEILIQMGYKYISSDIYDTMYLENYYNKLGITEPVTNDNVYLKLSSDYIEYNYSGYYSNYLESSELISDVVINSRTIQKPQEQDNSNDFYYYNWYNTWDDDYSYSGNNSSSYSYDSWDSWDSDYDDWYSTDYDSSDWYSSYDYGSSNDDWYSSYDYSYDSSDWYSSYDYSSSNDDWYSSYDYGSSYDSSDWYSSYDYSYDSWYSPNSRILKPNRHTINI